MEEGTVLVFLIRILLCSLLSDQNFGGNPIGLVGS